MYVCVSLSLPLSRSLRAVCACVRVFVRSNLYHLRSSVCTADPRRPCKLRLCNFSLAALNCLLSFRVWKCLRLSICIEMHKHTIGRTYTFMPADIYIYVFLYIYICTYSCIYLFIFVCIDICTRTYQVRFQYTSIYTYRHTCKYV